MAEQYKVAFQELASQIDSYSPQAVKVLETIFAEAGARVAYYAAFVIVCVHARKEADGYHGEADLSIDQLRNFTFFDYVVDNEQVLKLFTQALDIYNQEQQARV